MKPRSGGIVDVAAYKVVQPLGLAADNREVALSRRQRRVLGRELRDLVFRGCCVAGGFLGLSWALKEHRAHPERVHAACPAPQFAHCVSSGLSAAMMSWLVPVLVGLIIGALVGYLVASMIRLGQRPSGASFAGGGRWICARYFGNCQRCGCSVRPGDRIRHSPGHVLCASCGER